MSQKEEIERERAMFNKEDRKYLAGISEYVNGLSRKADYNRRSEISDRLIGTLKDFSFGQDRIQGDSWSMLLDRAQEQPKTVRDGMASAMALFYEIHERLGWDFEDTLRRAIEEAYLSGSVQRDLPDRNVNSVSLHTQIEKQEGIAEVNDRIRWKIQNGKRLTDREVRLALEYGDVGVKRALQEHFKNRRKEESREDWLENLQKDIEQFDEEPLEEWDVIDFQLINQKLLNSITQ